MNSEPFVQKPFIPEILVLSWLLTDIFLNHQTRIAVCRQRGQLTLVNTAMPIRDIIATIDSADNRPMVNYTGSAMLRFAQGVPD
jgi:hypothetical protein